MIKFACLGAACAVFALSVAASPVAIAQGVGQRSLQTDDVITVTGARRSLTAPDAQAARERLMRVPGGVGLVEAEVFADDFTQSLGDTLVFTPGVYADTSAQRESRISIRGSGLNATFERRGLTVRRDGVPISRASGITEFQEIDPLTIDYIEVYKGANGLRYGAASLGGAINIVTPTGRTQDETFTFRGEGGSFSTGRASASLAHAADKWDVYSGVTGLQSDGFRDHSDVRSLYGHSNVGYSFDNGVETRFYVTALTDNFELAGSLSLEDALATPTATSRPVTIGPFFPGGPVTVLDPGPEADDWDRNLDVIRVANKTVVPLDSVTLEAGLWYAYRDLDHAITRFAGVIVQQEDEVGGSVRLTGDWQLAGRDVAWVFGAEAATSSNNAKRYANISGDRGDLRSQSDQKARNLLVYGQADIAFTDNLTAVLGLQYLDTARESVSILNAVDGRVTESQVNPRVGLLWDVSGDAQLFVNVNRGFEPAGVTDLTAGGVLPFTPLEAQNAWTAEIGSRGGVGRFAWDIALYRSWVENEFIDLAQPAGPFRTISATFNADETVHQGVELGLDADLTPPALAEAGVKLLWRNIYTLNDFFFTSDPQDLNGASFAFDGNRLAGAPRHIYVAELRADADRWYGALNLRWVPDGPFADFANTVQAPGYALLGLTLGFDVTDRVRLFASAENLTDKVYISNISTVANQQLEDARIFTPGQGRAFYGGLTFKF